MEAEGWLDFDRLDYEIRERVESAGLVWTDRSRAELLR